MPGFILVSYHTPCFVVVCSGNPLKFSQEPGWVRFFMGCCFNSCMQSPWWQKTDTLGASCFLFIYVFTSNFEPGDLLCGQLYDLNDCRHQSRISSGLATFTQSCSEARHPFTYSSTYAGWSVYGSPHWITLEASLVFITTWNLLGGPLVG